MTQIESAKQEKISDELKKVAEQENVSIEYLIENVAKGTIVIPKNRLRRTTSDTLSEQGKAVQVRDIRICGIGKGLRTKVNANIGSSPDCISIEKELEKLEVAISLGADTVMDLSVGGDIKKIRREIIKNSTVPVGSVPIYQVACEITSQGKDISQMDPEHIFSVIEEHAEDKIDFITVHCGVTRKTVEILKNTKRICGVVSRGGAFLVKWIIANDKENPLYEQFDRLLDIAYKYDLTLSLGDGLRPGAIADASDDAQIGELKTIAKLVSAARAKNVQVIVEGPGHMPINQIAEHVKLQKDITDEAPFYVLGPIVTDIAPGYDHITSAIGGAVAAASGVDFLCYVTPSEHLHLPDVEDVRLGVIASRIAAHAGDIAKNIPEAKNRDKEFSQMRKSLDWEAQQKLALDKEKFSQERRKYIPSDENVCTMCGEFCAMRESSKVGI
ncbi:MAG: phosphomethylpyrimidine synthase ThiC [Elusimicrobiota bacterium]|nr:phosphomethylpyrimidine synthase ThiC [Elusimicrobiota bacterium]